MKVQHCSSPKNRDSDATIDTTSLKKLIEDCWDGKLEAVENTAPALLASSKSHGIHDPILTALL